jgi:tRNA(adenine34) deaminase
MGVSGAVFDDHYFMREALNLAKEAESAQEVPVGAVLVKQNQIIASGFNQSISSHDPSAHAEIVTLRQAAQNLKNYRLTDTTLYVTLEPCAMCAGALMHARIARLVYGAADPKAGAVESVFSLLNPGVLNHRIDYQSGVMAKECGQVLKDFFAVRR